MRRTLISSLAAIIVMVAAGSPAIEPLALAAQTKRAPTLKRRSPGSHARHTSAASRVSVVGPAYATHTLPANQYLRLRLNQTLSTRTAHAGDRFRTTVVTPVYASAVEVIPAGSTVEGHVTSAVPARSRGREGQIAVTFDKLVLPNGTRRSITGTLTELQNEKSGDIDTENGVSGKPSETRKIIYVGGGGLGGAVLGV